MPCIFALYCLVCLEFSGSEDAISRASLRTLLLALPCMPSIFALYCLVCLEFSGSEDAISRASLRTPLAPPWAWILLRIRFFATMPHSAPTQFHAIGRSIQTSMALPSMPCKFALYIALYALYSAVPKMLFREHLCTRFWHRLGLQSCWGSGVSQPCPRCSTGLFHGTGRSIQTSMALPCMPSIFALYCIVCLQFSGSEDAISRASLRTLLAPPWAWILLRIRCFATMPHNAPHGVSMVLAGPSGHLWLCLLCLFESISAHAWHRVAVDPVFRNHAHGAPQGFSMVLAGPSRHLWLCLLCLVYLPCILLCMPCNQRFRRCYFESISAHASGTALGYNPAGDPVFRNHAHGAPHGVSMVLAGPSRHLWLCLVCLLYLPCIALYALNLAVPKMLFREHLCARLWHRLGLESCCGSGVSQLCPTMLHTAFPWYWSVHRDIYGLWLCLLCLFETISAHAPGTALRLIRCFATMPTLLHRAFPWYWPVHPDIYGFAFYALYALYCLLFSSSEDAISRASLRTLLAPSGVESCWGSGVSQPCPTVFHSAFPWYWPVHLCLVRLVLPSV